VARRMVKDDDPSGMIVLSKDESIAKIEEMLNTIKEKISKEQYRIVTIENSCSSCEIPDEITGLIIQVPGNDLLVQVRLQQVSS